MPSPDDIGAAARDAAQAYGIDQYAAGSLAGAASRQPELDELEAQERADLVTIATLRAVTVTLQAAQVALQAAYDAKQAELDAYKARNPEAVPAPYVGSSMKGNGDPKPLEDAAGRPLGLRRTYWNLGQIDAAVATAKADIAAGRVPWLSFKPRTGQTWTDWLAGRADADIKALVAKLAALPDAVWLAIAHEPEGDGVMSDWVKAQQRFWPMIQAPNIKPWIILTGGDTFTIAQYSLDVLYPPGTKYNIALDGYNRYGDADHIGKGWSEMGNKFYDKVALEAQKRGVDWAIAETGYTDAAADRDADWLTRAYDDMAEHPTQPGAGLSYFNSDANSNGTWPLNAVKLPKFVGILNRSR